MEGGLGEMEESALRENIVEIVRPGTWIKSSPGTLSRGGGGR